MTKSRLLVSTPVSCPGHIYVSWSRSRPELCRRVSVCNGRWRQYRCHADAQYQTFLPVSLQALVVLDYELIIVMKTAAAVFLGRRRGALICAPPLLPLLLHSAHHKDSMYVMTLGNWNGRACLTVRNSENHCVFLRYEIENRLRAV